LSITQAGEEVLRQAARELAREEILGASTQQIIADMRDAVRAAPGVGLAAPQIGVALRLAVIEDREEYHAKATAEQLAERGRSPVPFHVIVNPRIVQRSGETAEFFEGCLSVPDYTAIVARARSVTVECLNERAEAVRIEASGWYARILQHEIDHLDGVLYLDRMQSRSFCALETAERLWKDVPVSEVQRRMGTGR
jgi:peptide deformylase